MEDFARRIRQLQSVLPEEFAQREEQQVMGEYRQLIDERGLPPLQVKELRYLIEQDYQRGRTEPGRLVGIIAGQSIGENITQANMKAHQQAGVSSARQNFSGFDRVKELLHASQNPHHPTMRIYLNRRLTQMELREAKAQFQMTIVLDLMRDSRILPIERMNEEWHELHQRVFNVKPDFQPQPYGIRLYMNKYELYIRRMMLSTIGNIINNSDSRLKAMWSGLDNPIIDVFTSEEIGTINVEGSSRRSPLERYLRDTVLPSVRGLHVSGIPGLSRLFEENILFPSLIASRIPRNDTDVQDELWEVINLRNDEMYRIGVQRDWMIDWLRLSSLELVDEGHRILTRGLITTQNVPYRRLGRIDGDEFRIDRAIATSFGIPIRTITDRLIVGNERLRISENVIRITDANRELVSNGEAFSPRKQQLGTYWFFTTEGSNMSLIYYVDGINIETTISDSVWQVYDTFGIEAARQLLIQELQANIPGVNFAHIQLLVDKLTFYGKPISIDRHGHKKQAVGFMERGNFEENMKNFQASAAVGEVDTLRSLSASVITGKLAATGAQAATVVAPRRGGGEIEFGVTTEVRPEAPTPRVRRFGVRR